MKQSTLPLIMAPASHIALIGCGRWGKNILRDLLDLGCEVSVVARSESSRKNASGAARIVPAINELAGGRPLDGVVIATTTSTHSTIIREVCRELSAVPIFCEKCLCPDPATARELVALTGESLFVMDKWRYHPGILALAELVQTKELGGLIGVRTSRNGWGCPHQDVDSVWILLSHELSILLELTGQIPEPAAARMDIRNGWAQGMVAMLGTRPWAVVEVSSRYAASVRETRLFFEQGVAVLDDSYAQAIKIVRTPPGSFTGAPVEELRPISQEMPLRQELKCFVEYVQGRRPAPKSSAADACRIVETMARLRSLAGDPK